MTFFPSINDFEDHSQLSSSATANYPPFPARLMVQQKANYSVTEDYRQTQQGKRRVRPIAVPPPPGFEHSDSASSVRGGAMGFVAASGPSDPRKAARFSSGYLNNVKIRAIAGALAGDWAMGRSLPDIPLFLLTHMLLHFDAGPSSSQNAQSGFNQDLASFCLAHNIHSNLTSPIFGGSTSAYSSSALNGGQDIMEDRLRRPRNNDHPDSRAMYPVPNPAFARPSAYIEGLTPQKSSASKRRLAPTQVTAEALFTHSFNPDTVDPVVAVSQVQKSGGSFQRTPRAPTAISSSHDKEKPAARPLGVFSSAAVSSLADELEVVSVDFADITVDDASDSAITQESARRKITPPPPSSPKHRVSQRLKQLSIGKNTPEYGRYIALIPYSCRKRGDPVTPDVHQEISKRNWEGQVRKWRRLLHAFDPIDENECASEAESAGQLFIPSVPPQEDDSGLDYGDSPEEPAMKYEIKLDSDGDVIQQPVPVHVIPLLID
eukprot:Partr_v1_DN28584_c0_g1_i2_m72856 putative stem-loop binding protein